MLEGIFNEREQQQWRNVHVDVRQIVYVMDLTPVVQPLFLKYNVSVVLTGHDHFYERTKPQKGIVYFVVGSGGQLRKGNIDTRTGLSAAGNDQDQSFMIAEINGDEMWFNAISRQGKVFDSGSLTRRK